MPRTVPTHRQFVLELEEAILWELQEQQRRELIAAVAQLLLGAQSEQGVATEDGDESEADR